MNECKNSARESWPAASVRFQYLCAAASEVERERATGILAGGYKN